MMLARLIRPMALAASLAASAAAFADERPAPADAVLDRHLAAFADRDLDAIMADYSEDSVFITPEGILRGPDEIRPLFRMILDEFAAPEARLTIHARHVDGALAYTLWSAETPAHVYRIATDTLVIRDDRILYQTFAAEMEAKD
ncbi:nuclear transport factor 2 family protein [Acuticoccus kandeliae]|uniref:nuclear transport factor 2 family protein n=1 Tax=Acuticoccus kandeliae TaxID=2073160 RepID=UPI00196B740F|nr:nuclear transport factor 2 family protein [Acuticoccus kandeliae]